MILPEGGFEKPPPSLNRVKLNVVKKIYFEKNDAKKVIYLIAYFLEGVEPMFLCILMELECLLLGMI